MFDQLKNYYNKNGISALHFRCDHYESCRGSCKKFVEASEASVGSEYEKHTLPRVLFLSLDPGSAESNPEARTLAVMRQGGVQDLGEKNKHWYRTHELASIFLKHFKKGLNIEDVSPYFAHTNSAKCCMNKDENSRADYRLFENCREYIPGEIRILDPDILITQGDEAKWAIEIGFAESNTPVVTDPSECNYHLIEMNGKNVLWFHTFHPRRFGDFYRQRRTCFEKWAKEAYQYLSLHGWGIERQR